MNVNKYLYTQHQNTPESLLHPILKTDENLAHAKNAILEDNSKHPKQSPNKVFLKENLEQIEEMSWLKKCDCILFTPTESESQEQALDRLLKQIKHESELIQDEVALNEAKPVLALDLETTGLNTKFKKINGRNVAHLKMVGVCLATSKNKGYYIPTSHNEEDGIKNFDINLIIPFLQQLVNDYHVIYHNAVYDQEVLAIHGIHLDNHTQTFSDTLLLANLMGWKQRFRTVGLKFLSAEMLNRKMLEIKEIAESSDVRLQNIPAINAYVYGCSDAMNTLGLFHFITSKKDNPYLTQTARTLLEHKVVASVRSMFRFGLPIEYNTLLNTTRTTIRRILMLENIFYDKVTDDNIEISSAEQCGTHIYKLLKKEFEDKYCPGHVLNKGEKGYDILVKKLQEDFELGVKITELKTGTKISANLPESALNKLYANLDKWDYIKSSIKDEIWTICEVLMQYRSLLQRYGILIAMLRDSFNDDTLLNRVPIALRLSGTDTGRFSNAGSKNGAFDHVAITHMKTKIKTEIIEGGGSSSFNAQGLSHDTGKVKKLKRVKNINQLAPEIKEANIEFDKMIDNYLYESMIEG